MPEQDVYNQEPIKGPEELKRLKRIVAMVYLLQMLSFAAFFPMLAGLYINYAKREEIKGCWLESHFKWQLNTFWYGLIWTGIGIVSSIFIVGYFILLLNAIWITVRIAKGWLKLNDGLPMHKPKDR